MAQRKGLRFGSLAVGLLFTLACQEPKVGPAVSPMGPSPLVVEPALATVTTGQGTAFAAKGQDGSHPGVTWEALGGGTVDAAGRYTAPAGPGRYEVQAKAFGGRVAKATVNLVPPPRGPVEAPAHVKAGERGVRASVPDQPGSTYAWTVEGGTLSGASDGSSVTFDAGSGSRVLLGCRVVNGAGLGMKATLELPLVEAVALKISPRIAVVTAGMSRKFGFSLEGGRSGEVVWSVLEAKGGSVDRTGTYTAPAATGLYTVQVASREDPARKDALTVKVVAEPRGAIRGPGKVTALAKGLRASVPEQAGCVYAWKVTGGTVTGGAQGPMVTFDAGAGPRLKLVCEITNEAGDAFQAELAVPVAAP